MNVLFCAVGIPILLQVILAESEPQTTIEGDLNIGDTPNCQELNRLKAVRTLKTLAYNYLADKQIVQGDVKYNLTNCFWQINSIQELILQLKEYIFGEDEDEMRELEEDMCREASNCLENRSSWAIAIIRTRDEEMKKLAQITFLDAKCYFEEYKCPARYGYKPLLSASSFATHFYASKHSVFFFLCLSISAVILHNLLR